MSTVSPRGRLVLLGASNLRRGLSRAISVAESGLSGPLDVLCAAGHGRSYGVVSTFLFVRCLPSIRDCGLWEALASGPRLPTRAWVGDIGNDLLYGVRAERVLMWLSECVDRLRAEGAEVVVSQLPLSSLRKLGPVRFRLLRALTYPRSRLGYEEAMASIRELNEGIKRLSASHGVATCVPRAEWYGWDPIHIRARRHESAWKEFMSGWFGVDASLSGGVSTTYERSRCACSSMLKRVNTRRLRPLRRTLFGFEQRQSQPVLVRKDGFRLSLF